MKFFIIEYLKCEPAEFIFRVLALNGFWPLTTTKTWLKKLHIVYSYICNFSITSTLFIQILDVYLLRNDLLGLVKTLSMSSITFMCVARHYLLSYQMDDIMALHRRLEAVRDTRTDPEAVEIIKRANTDITRTTRFFGYMVMICVLVWTLAPVLDRGKTRQVMYPYRLPVDELYTPIYEILYTYQALAMIGFMNNVIFTDMAFCSFIIRINALNEILIHDIENIGREEYPIVKIENERGDGIEDKKDIDFYVPVEEKDVEICNKIRNDFKKCVKFHQSILREIKVLSKIYSTPSLVFFAAVIIMLGVILIDIVMISKSFRLQKYYKVWYSLCAISDEFLWCYFADSLKKESSNVITAFYNVRWYRFHPKLRKDFLIPLLNEKVIPKLKVGNIFSLSLSTFLDVMRITYNMTVVLYQTINK